MCRRHRSVGHSEVLVMIPTPAIDVLIPVFNGAETITIAVESILKQTFRNISIVVVDDGSLDETPRLLQQLAKRDRRVRVITKHNSGIVDALNLGLSHCSAPLVARHDGDDIAFPERLERQFAFLQRHPDCVAVSCFARHVDERGRFLGSYASFPPPENADPNWIPSREPYLLHPFLLARRDALVEVGGYRHVWHSEDTDLYWRLQERGTLANLPEVLGDYRYHSQSITSRSQLNGRISALNSQLAAVSAQRRRLNQLDFDFSSISLDMLSKARTSVALAKIVAAQLTLSEQANLTTAFAAKLLELTSYRPYELDLEDCRFIGEACRLAEPGLTAPNRTEVRRLRAIAIARLLRRGHAHSAAALLDRTVIAQTGVRFILQLLESVAPPSLLTMVRGVRHRRRLAKA